MMKGVCKSSETIVALKKYFVSCIYFVDSLYVRTVFSLSFAVGIEHMLFKKTCVEFVLIKLHLNTLWNITWCQSWSMQYEYIFKPYMYIWNVCYILNKNSV